MLGDIFFDNHLPIRTPTILEHIKARELPRKTIIGLPDSAESINVAIWVLSPSSAIKIVVKVVIKIDKKYFRPCEVNSLIGDATKAKEKLNWQPKTNLEELVADMIKNDLQLAKKDFLLKKKGYELSFPRD